jgi:hypothetical protein
MMTIEHNSINQDITSSLISTTSDVAGGRQGRRHDLSLKGVEHGYSPLGGATKLFSPKFLIKISPKLKFIVVNP